MKNVSAAVIVEGSTVLIARRAIGQSLEGFWEFPGGKQSLDESIFECLERELFEEFGVRSKALEIFKESVYEYEGGAINLIGIITELESKDLALTVHDDFVWSPISSLLTYNLAPADIPIAEEIINTYGRNH